MSKNTLNATAHQRAGIRYQLSVIAPDGAERICQVWKKNLILDNGLARLANDYTWDEAIRAAVVGTGATPTRRDSGNITFTQTGQTVTASAAFFSNEDVGRLLKLDTGEEAKIQAVTDTVTATVDTAREHPAASEGTVWYVNQTGLTAETMRTATYGSGGEDNTVSIVDNQVVRKRTFIFAPVTAQVTLHEIGWSWNDYNSANSLFGRDVLEGGGVTLVPGQQLKVVLNLYIDLSPLSPVVMAGPFWTGGGGEVQLENLGWPSMISPNRYEFETFLGDSTEPFTHPNTGDTFHLGGAKSRKIASRLAYVAGSFRRVWRSQFTLNDGNSTNINCMSLGWSYYDTIYPLLRIRFDQPQTKDSDNALTVDWAMSWGRVLIN
ncbi:hypothetical protein Ga0100231_005365 [Opitutaceae bacterium TAV4]|nr:hypothetical protein Ga0100231_005365 [Opitutaceae bacterium TAV4]RRK02592.1 hypothetical protein Ga0100230_005615 [Opitutaceae bacterium TAV3]